MTRWVWGLGELTFDPDGKPIKMLGTVQDITERKLGEIREGHRKTVLGMLFDRLPMQVIFDRLIHDIESQNPGMICAILLLDRDGQHLLHGAAPGLPDFYIQAIDGLVIGPEVGSCGAAS